MQNQRRLMPLAGILLVLCLGAQRNAEPADVHANSAASIAPAISEVLVEDFSNMVTAVDLGSNGFAGNSGTTNKNGRPYITCEVIEAAAGKYAQRCQWSFSDNDREAYTGLFFCIFGLCDTKSRFAGSPLEASAEVIFFPEHSLNLDAIDGVLNEPGGPRAVNTLRLELSYKQATPFKLRIEIKDAYGGMRFKRFLINRSDQPITLTWDFRTSSDGIGYSGDLNFQQAKVLALIVERENIGDRVSNPLTGQFDLSRISFVPNRPEERPSTDAEMLDLLERRAFQYFIDWSSRKTTLANHPGRSSYGIPQDRSTFGDLLTVGGIGFALPAYIIGAERGWISRTEAVSRTSAVLRRLNDSSAFGPEPSDRVGYKGWFYHFLGVDGRRKLNFDFDATPVDEAKNTVELSTIDTGLALMGVLAAQSYFTGATAEEQSIRDRAQAIYDRVDWAFMQEPKSKQFYLGWKPLEQRDAVPAFQVSDPDANGHYSGTAQAAATLDYYTDEALIVTLLAAGSTTHPAYAREAYCALIRERKNGSIVSYPGTLFTYQFLHAFIDTRNPIFSPCPGEQVSVNWFNNSKQVIHQVLDHAIGNPGSFETYGASAWGISAAEGPSDRYLAYGVPSVAFDPNPTEDGTVTYYGMVSSLGFARNKGGIIDETLYSAIVQGIYDGWDQGRWHYRFALPDAFNKNIVASTTGCQPSCPDWIRTQGSWMQRAQFAIDQGPMLLHLENSRSGLIWDLLAKNDNIKRAMERLRPPPAEIVSEAEGGSGNGTVTPRSNASHQQTVRLHRGEARILELDQKSDGCYLGSMGYSNDGSADTLEVSVDGVPVWTADTRDTRPVGGVPGSGWNRFMVIDFSGKVCLTAGRHPVVVKVLSADDYGVEIDYVRLSVAALTLAKSGSGTGTVVSSEQPPQVNCGALCSTRYETTVELTALASKRSTFVGHGSIFAGWSGEECQGVTDQSCAVTPNKSSKTVTALFEHALVQPDERLVIDFCPYGIWSSHGNGNWSKLHDLCSVQIVSADLDGNGQADLVVNFGRQYGIWSWMNRSTWVKLHDLSPISITAADLDGNGKADLVINFGNPHGIWRWMNNQNWVKLHDLSPVSITASDLDGNGQSDLAVNFGNPYGLWVWMNNQRWTKLHDLSPASVTTARLDTNAQQDLVVDFPPYGIWKWMNNTSWQKLHDLPARLATAVDLDGNGQDDLVISFGDPYGLWRWMNNQTWEKLHDLSPALVTAAYLDGNARQDLAIHFPPYGIWQWINNASWMKLHDLPARHIVALPE